MANVLEGNPWLIDTASGTAITTERVRILGFRWVGASAAGHACIVTDSGGVTIWESLAAGSNYVESDTFPVVRVYRGLTVPTLASGRLYVEFG